MITWCRCRTSHRCQSHRESFCTVDFKHRVVGMSWCLWKLKFECTASNTQSSMHKSDKLKCFVVTQIYLALFERPDAVSAKTRSSELCRRRSCRSCHAETVTAWLFFSGSFVLPPHEMHQENQEMWIAYTPAWYVNLCVCHVFLDKGGRHTAQRRKTSSQWRNGILSKGNKSVEIRERRSILALCICVSLVLIWGVIKKSSMLLFADAPVSMASKQTLKLKPGNRV